MFVEKQNARRAAAQLATGADCPLPRPVSCASPETPLQAMAEPDAARLFEHHHSPVEGTSYLLKRSVDPYKKNTPPPPKLQLSSRPSTLGSQGPPVNLKGHHGQDPCASERALPVIRNVPGGMIARFGAALNTRPR